MTILSRNPQLALAYSEQLASAPCSELGNTLQSWSEEIDSQDLTAERAESLQLEIDQVWIQNEDDERICATLDRLTARLMARVDEQNMRRHKWQR